MELLNKIVYYNEHIYKVQKLTKTYVYVNTLKIDNKIYLESHTLRYHKTLNIKDEILTHYTNEIELKHKFKIKRCNFNNVVIIDDITTHYLHNSKLCSNYANVWATIKGALTIQKHYYFYYYIQLLTNDDVKQRKKWRETELLLFIFTIIGFNHHDTEENINILKHMNLFDKYIILKNEAEPLYYADKQLIKNVCCPVCLSSDVNNFKGFYSCSHHICNACYCGWKNGANTCPLCRAI
jgi:hypothetical protein